MDRGAWEAIVHRISKSWTQLKKLSAHVRMKQLMVKGRTRTSSGAEIKEESFEIKDMRSFNLSGCR